ncbi:HNH endonuclease signature motif containing protein [Corynebacterium sp. HMSC29G08]|uniref:HNH endonuclease signature motif containing protein n=1 Tax=Corynebacterium sp. HMSC29G08 TaxID=1581069 RepID=UPI0008A5ABDA|nr:HNH endonuclease signature motif containing protein [Corynebacterium sp. HMSC29G08]OFT82471.1 hypothetical protein HMPREF3101_07310 [Corynebacterium sp. HMSC29G08]
MTTELTRLVETLGSVLLRIRDMFADPDQVQFVDVYEDMERLEGFIAAKGLIDASFAAICERDEAGRLVGAKHATAYLKERLGCSPKDAYDRLARGRDLFGEPVVPEGDDLFGAAPGAGGVDDEAEQERQRQERERQEQRERARKAQREARQRAEKINAAKQEAIRQELDELVKEALGERLRLLNDALREADSRDVVDLRRLVRSWVDRENRRARRGGLNPNVGMEHRSVTFGRQRSDGNYDVRMVLPASDMALLKAYLDKGLAPNSNLPEGVEDYRTPTQRRYDQFARMLRHVDHCDKPTSDRGCASVVVSVTLDQLADADAHTKFQTNTGIELSPFDLVRLGMDGTPDFVLTIDAATSTPLNLYRTHRTASIEQRITLLAVHGVCAWVGCNVPLSESEAHHITSWIRGGNTDIGNLAPLCRHHHRRNNDQQDNRYNTSHVESEPGTGRVGVRRDAENVLEFNTSTGAQQAAAAKLRRQYRARGDVSSSDDSGGAADPPPNQSEFTGYANSPA